jgi:hypothetical protein
MKCLCLHLFSNNSNSLFEIFDFDDSMLNGVGSAAATAVEDDTSIYIAEKEWDRFLAEPPVEMNANPDIWWFKKKNMYPRLSKLYRKYNGAVVSSVPCERVGFLLSVY